MADKVREEGRQQRQGARERRRSLAQEPFEKLDEAAHEEGGGSVDVAALVKRALGTAATAAFVGAVAGAGKAIVDRRRPSDPPEPRDEAREEEDEVATGEQPEDAVDPAAAEDAEPDPQEREEASSDQPPEPEDRTGAEDPEGREPVDEQDGSDSSSQVPEQGAASADVAKIIERARNEVEQLLGTEAEGVSGIERSNGSWCVTVEVVEVRRVPDSTDVLASYGVVLDEDGNLVSLERKRRYRRSQVEEV
jgi:hypothetical protein